MKTKLLYFLVPFITLSYSCDDEDKLKTTPTLEISNPTEVTTTTAIMSGGISSRGNGSITETGFVYSSNVAQPTTADNKTKASGMSDNFSVKLEGLASGTTFHVRAYAINELGTGYSEVIDLVTGNAGPTASELSVDGLLEVNKTVTAKYKYNDAEGNAEGISTFQWYASDDATGASETAIAGATEKTYLIQDNQNGKFLRFSVIPQATVGTTAGIEFKSNYTSTAVGAETVTFTYGGSEVTYGTIVSQATRKKWLDRNLGATQVAQSVDDYQAYGDLFQWGRSADGHQTIVRTGKANGESAGKNGTTTTKSATVVAPDNLFVIWDQVSLDWLATPTDDLWQGVEGVNNPCPAGWRLPTQGEWDAEQITTVADGFSKIKITFTGYREAGDGEVYALTTLGGYSSSTTGEVEGNKQSVIFSARKASASSALNVRGNGSACRCIKD